MSWWVWLFISYFGMNFILAVIHLVKAFIEFTWADFKYYFPIHGSLAFVILLVGAPDLIVKAVLWVVKRLKGD